MHTEYNLDNMYNYFNEKRGSVHTPVEKMRHIKKNPKENQLLVENSENSLESVGRLIEGDKTN